ncbi:MAG: hypothetical protein GX970_05425 [Phyllobacteriaceae bacterium]|nr:hypothetical protein [Phyllobacteriaceae bacterium]
MTNSPPSSLFYRPRLGQAAKVGQLVVARCILCKRSQHYLASDLVTVYGADTYIEDVFGGACPHCGSGYFWSVRTRYPTNDDVGHLKIRRPAGVRTIQLWKDEYYGPPA